MTQAEKERLAKVGKTFNAKSYIKKEIESIRAQVGDRKVLLAMSGGVDSSVCAVLLHQAIGRQLTCVFVDHGCMRLNEGKEIKKVFKGKFGINLICVEAEKRFLDKTAGVTDPEQKRKIIGAEFVRVFEEEAKKLGKVDFLGQGTIFPDIAESGAGGHKAVKAHHNVGGLPKDMGFEGLVEPVKYLYKDEVRAVGKGLGIPEHMVMRQPFPGPGLAVRCLGELTKEKLDILRKADFVFLFTCSVDTLSTGNFLSAANFTNNVAGLFTTNIFTHKVICVDSYKEVTEVEGSGFTVSTFTCKRFTVVTVLKRS